ncbi:phage minor head protein [Methanobrevibacter sp.]|uniref:phage minor head protein n=1 Tax=Methanobrevibacter sp. TaxID=66852 RepID=UPI00386F28A9
MTLTQKQLRNLKTELTYSKVEHLLSQYYEDQLAKEVSKIFQEMEYQVINNLAEYYNPEVMFKAHTDLILAPIHEMHKQYYELLCKYKIREFDKSRASGKRIVERLINFRRKGNILSKQYTVLKADINDAVSSTITKDKLFGTLPDVHENLRTRTYQLSEKTLARVDGQINDIIVKGYDEGKGIDAVSRDIRRRFGQLKTWESVRIARTETHNSQCLGVIKGYDDMGVEYIQWSTARDSRVRGLRLRDSADHVHMEGEIIRMGGVFSNGLMYPGDMAGPAAEIINCRCQALPFIIPYGYIAPPDMAQFHEEDLIATLDYFHADELVEQAMAETELVSSDHFMRPINPNIVDNFKVNSLPDFGKMRHPLPLTDEIIEKYPKDFLLHKYHDYQDYSSKIARWYESHYTDEFMKEMKRIIPENKLPGTQSIYDSFKYGCGNNFGRLNHYYRDKSAYAKYLKDLGESDSEIKTITERYDKIEENLLKGMKQGIPLVEDTFTYRATSTDHEIPVKPGEKGVFKGFTSTSFDKETPMLYYQRDSKKYNVFYHILNPKGTRGMALESTDKLTNTNGQAELLIPESEYEIVHAYKNGKNYVLTVRLINQII